MPHTSMSEFCQQHLVIESFDQSLLVVKYILLMEYHEVEEPNFTKSHQFCEIACIQLVDY